MIIRRAEVEELRKRRSIPMGASIPVDGLLIGLERIPPVLQCFP